MGTAADYTILVLLVALGVGLWSVFDRLGQIERELAALKRKLGVTDEEASSTQSPVSGEP